MQISSPSTFNEEDGEILLGIVARTMASSTHQSVFASVNQQFKLSRVMTEYSKGLANDLDVKENSHPHTKVKAGSKEVRLIVDHLTQVLIGMREGSWRPYQAGEHQNKWNDADCDRKARTLINQPQKNGEHITRDVLQPNEENQADQREIEIDIADQNLIGKSNGKSKLGNVK